MTNRSTRVPTSRRRQRARLSTGLRSASQSLMFAQIAFFSAARASTSNGRIAEHGAATGVRTSRYDTRRPAELSGRARQQREERDGTPKGKVAFRKGHMMADGTKIVVARVYPKPGRLQEVINVYAGIVPLVYEEPGCELFALHTDSETVFVVERWATPADLQGHAAGPAYAQIRAGISDLVDHAPDVWILDPLSFGEAVKGTIGSAPYAVTSRYAENTA
jgi:quinol monooxygenase YgiN